MTKVTLGLERFVKTPLPAFKGRRLGLLCNPASVDSGLRHARKLIDRCYPGQLTALYAPQHGFYAEKQDNMVESADMVDPLMTIPVFSLYGKTRIPTREMFAPIDTLVVDLQDVGTRVYTFATTLSYCLEAARRFDIQTVVLDRPNPLGGIAVEGNCLQPACASFVGRYPIPMRHGLTMGELARLFNREYGIDCRLDVIPMDGWRREMNFRDTGLPWVAPSPNLPTPESALVYPGQVLWEGTHVSEGRGTTQPFELFGAPYFDIAGLQAEQVKKRFPGAVLRPAVFEPTSGKWAHQRCHGFQIHVTDPDHFRPYTTSLEMLAAVIRLHKDRFQWKSPPYEYEYRRRPIDLIIGDVAVRQQVAAGVPVNEIEAVWQPGLQAFERIRRRHLLYEA